MSDVTSPTIQDASQDAGAAGTAVAASAAAPLSPQGQPKGGSATSPPDPSDPNAQITVRALVSTKEAGVIIGKGGANVAELREQTGVKAGVSKVVQGVHDRVLSVTGTLDGISRAYSLIAHTILENPVTAPNADASAAPVAPNAVTAVRLLISHNLMGTVIGRQGLKIKHIQDISGARMVASKDMLLQSTERVVEVQGTTEAIRVAVLEIARCLLEDWERGQGTVLYHPGHTDGAGVLAAGGAGGLQPQGARRSNNLAGPGAGGYLSGAMTGLSLTSGNRRQQQQPYNGSGGYFGGKKSHANNDQHYLGGGVGADAASGAVVTPGGSLSAAATSPGSAPPPAIVDSANIRTQNISIPADMVGCIIGKGGSKITEIRRLSGSRISIAKVAHDDSGERMFTIQGTPEANEKALFLLYTQLESEKERRTSSAAQEGEEEEGGQKQQESQAATAAAEVDADGEQS